MLKSLNSWLWIVLHYNNLHKIFIFNFKVMMVLIEIFSIIYIDIYDIVTVDTYIVTIM